MDSKVDALRESLDHLANQLCRAVDGDFDLLLETESDDDVVQKIVTLMNFVADSARRAIVEVEQRSAELLTKETRYRELFASMSDGVAVYEPVNAGHDFVIRDVNQASLQIEMISREAVIGRRITEVFPGVEEFGLLALMRRVAASGVAEQLPARLYRDERIEGWRESFVYPLPTGEIVVVYRDVTAAKTAEATIKAALHATEAIIDAAPIALVLVRRDGIIRRANAAAVRILDGEDGGIVGRRWSEFVAAAETDGGSGWSASATGSVASNAAPAEIEAIDSGGKHITIMRTVIPVTIAGEETTIEAFLDLTERRRLEAQLRHSQKLEAVGQLAAGMAHEINTPAQYVGDSLEFLRSAFEELRQLVVSQARAVEAMMELPGSEAINRALGDAISGIDMEFIDENVPGALDLAAGGITRIASIVGAMKEFAHPDMQEKRPADLNRAIENALVVAENEYRYVAVVETQFGELPPVRCHIGDIRQIVVNLVVNAAQAVRAVVGESGTLGLVSVRTSRHADHVCIEVEDSGCGIPEAIRGRIFDPFFTTRDVGSGCGQGLAVARSLVVDKHQGTLTFKSEPGRGTTFFIHLPINNSASPLTPRKS